MSFSNGPPKPYLITDKEVQRTNGPRNGIAALSKSANCAFDRGIFTISDQYDVIVNPKTKAASIANFPALDLDLTNIRLPEDSYYRRHFDASIFANIFRSRYGASRGYDVTSWPGTSRKSLTGLLHNGCR